MTNSFFILLRATNSSDPVMVPMNLEFIKDLWVPNIFIYNLKTYKVINVLSKLAGLWIDTDKNVLYSQATHITFICPMRFDKFPLDTQTCRFRVGSYSYDSSKLLFITKNCGYSSKETNSIALDYDIRKFVTWENSWFIKCNIYTKTSTLKWETSINQQLQWVRD